MPEGIAGSKVAAEPHLLIDVAGTACALPQTAVREILPLPHLHEPPAAGGALAGFLNLAGDALPVIDLATLFGLRERSEPDPYRHLVVAADGTLVLLVDRVLDLVRLEPEAVKPVDGRHTLNGCVSAEIALDGALVHLLDLGRILSAEESARIAIHAKRARERLAALSGAER